MAPRFAAHIFCQRQAVMTQVVRSPFKYRHFDRPAERARQFGHVLVEKLVLQIARAGRNGDPDTGQQRGNQVGESLAGTGAGFDQQPPAGSQCSADRQRHFLLRRARRVTVYGIRQRAIGCKNVAKILHIFLDAFKHRR